MTSHFKLRDKAFNSISKVVFLNKGTTNYYTPICTLDRKRALFSAKCNREKLPSKNKQNILYTSFPNEHIEDKKNKIKTLNVAVQTKSISHFISHICIRGNKGQSPVPFNSQM